MNQGLELSGLAAAVVLALPIVLLLWTAVRGTRARPRPYAEKATSTLLSRPLPPNRESVPPLEVAKQPEAPTAILAPEQPSRPTDAEIKAAARAEASGHGERVVQAEAKGEAAELPSLYLAEARALVAAGDDTRAADRLRSSIRAAARLGQKIEHAEARLELGDLAAKHGDLTTACEHWSMARGLMHELKHAEGIGRSEARIRNNGCPTDWVLNDF